MFIQSLEPAHDFVEVRSCHFPKQRARQAAKQTPQPHGTLDFSYIIVAD